MFFKQHKLLTRVRTILGFVGGGVHKRIDENRELLELLQSEAPEFLSKHHWVEGWIRSHDDFFVDLAGTVPIEKGTFLGQAVRNPERFPRPWPSRA
jgi:hypothetical protein